ncbi:MAG: COX15/CtaA family protein [Gordonia sp. (in: high G+C Gram-positive bacteria)]|uniref:COX15/CtaA family protein n=1 Tax=Gordonia TaxID=2053 RepID=UPI003265A030
MIATWFGFKRPTAKFLYYWAIANVTANVVLVVTGGAVRVTDSGLGCPTWPQCTSGSVTPHAAMGIHGVIEFGNRMLTWVLVAVAVATFVAAWRRVPVDPLARKLSIAVAMGVPLQAIIGGITVLTNLNPWIVSFHFLATMVIISAATWLVVHTRPGRPAVGVDAEQSAVLRRFAVLIAWAIYALTWVTIYLGTVVTGSGPHAGDIKAHRNGLEPTQATQLHVDAVWTLVGLTIALILLTIAAVSSLRRAAGWFGAVIVVQGVIGYVQYAAGLPEVLVILHMFGSALLMIGATTLVLATRR